jgi:hypothetical protein
MAATIRTVAVVCDCELRIPRGDAGDLDDGARAVLENVDGVREADVRGIDGMRPDAFDLYVDATARVTMAAERPVDADATGDAEGAADAADLAARLRDGFGVVGVERCDIAQ